MVVKLKTNPLQVDYPRNNDMILNVYTFFDCCLQLNSVVYFEICLSGIKKMKITLTCHTITSLYEIAPSFAAITRKLT